MNICYKNIIQNIAKRIVATNLFYNNFGYFFFLINLNNAFSFVWEEEICASFENILFSDFDLKS